MVKIPNVNNNVAFEMPKRKPKHRIMLYEKMVQLEKEKPDEMKKREYRQLMEGAYLALFIIQDKHPDAKIEDILSLSDDMNDDENILRVSCIAYGTDYDEIKKTITGETKDFQKTEQNQ